MHVAFCACVLTLILQILLPCSLSQRYMYHKHYRTLLASKFASNLSSHAARFSAFNTLVAVDSSSCSAVFTFSAFASSFAALPLVSIVSTSTDGFGSVAVSGSAAAVALSVLVSSEVGTGAVVASTSSFGSSFWLSSPSTLFSALSASALALVASTWALYSASFFSYSCVCAKQT